MRRAQRVLFSSSTLFLRPFSQNGFPKYFFSTRISVETIREEFIKPSSPTPYKLKAYELSFIDKLSPPLYMPFILFYPKKDDNVSVEEKLSTLKSSLSKTLNRFYPLAGRVDRSSNTIDCNDTGALFKEAKVGNQMIDYLKSPKMELIKEFLQYELFVKGPLEMAPQVVVQANIFACGGIALGICMLHKLVDGSTFGTFIKTWAAIANGNSNEDHLLLSTPNVENIGASLFPCNNELSSTNLPFIEALLTSKKRKNNVTRFVFDANAIAILKEKARSQQVPNPTRLEVVSGLIWKCAMNASEVSSGTIVPASSMVNTANIRQRLNPQLPLHSIGNLRWKAIATCEVKPHVNMELSSLVGLLRRSIHEIDANYLEKFKGREGTGEFVKLVEQERESISGTISRKPIVYVGTSVTNMGFYEINFGWGKPLWVTIAPSVETIFSNFIFQIENKNGDGVEALVVLEENEVKALEEDHELLTYATLNPNI